MNRIKKLRTANNISQKELADELNIHQTAISQWETGRTNPDVSTARELAKIFNVSIGYILGDLDDESEDEKGVRIPVIGISAAGLPIGVERSYIDNTDPDTWEEISRRMAAGGTYVAIRIKGDSMEPKISDGDIVIVSVQDTIEDGETAIVLINDDEATCKRVKRTSAGLTLISTNPKYDPMFFTPREVNELPVRIFGKVVELRSRF